LLIIKFYIIFFILNAESYTHVIHIHTYNNYIKTFYYKLDYRYDSVLGGFFVECCRIFIGVNEIF